MDRLSVGDSPTYLNIRPYRRNFTTRKHFFHRGLIEAADTMELFKLVDINLSSKKFTAIICLNTVEISKLERFFSVAKSLKSKPIHGNRKRLKDEVCAIYFVMERVLKRRRRTENQ